MQQLALPTPLAHDSSLLSWDNFITAKCNAKIYERLYNWHTHSEADRHILICAPQQSGKTTITNLWAQYNRAYQIHTISHGLHLLNVQTPLPVLIDNMDCIFGQSLKNQELLFHLINHLRDNQVIITCTTQPHEWPNILPDLLSRLQKFSRYNIELPDDDMLIKLVILRFSMLQLAIKPQVAQYVIRHIRRDFASVLWFVDKAVAAIEACPMPITIPFVKHLLLAMNSNDIDNVNTQEI